MEVEYQKPDIFKQISEKYSYSLKSSQNNPSKLLNKICTQELTNLLENIQFSLDNNQPEKYESIWNIIKFGLFSKQQGNAYLEFFKNLPISFTKKSNYQAAILFTTIQNEKANINIICKFYHLFVKEIFDIVKCDYKLKIQIVQFCIDLIWDMCDEQSIDSVFEAVINVFTLVNDSLTYNHAVDITNGNIFETWLKAFIQKTLSYSSNERYGDLLHILLKLNHVILDDFMSSILTCFVKQDGLIRFLKQYIDVHVNVRQFSKLTHKLIDYASKNKELNFPNGFYEHYEKCLENYNVDIQTIVNLWDDVLKQIEADTLHNLNLSIELSKFLKCILNRVNICTSTISTAIKIQSIDLLNKTKNTLKVHLVKHQIDEPIYAFVLDNLITCAFLHLIIYRYSQPTILITQDDIAKLINEINDELNLKKLLKQAKAQSLWQIQLNLNKLKLFHLYAMKLLPVRNENENLSIKNILRPLLSVNLPKNEQVTKLTNMVTNSDEYELAHWKLLIFDHLHMIWEYVQLDERKMVLVRLFELLLMKKNEPMWKLDSINLDTIFNDKTVLNDLFDAFLHVLNESRESHSPQSNGHKRKNDSEEVDKNMFEDLNEYLNSSQITNELFSTLSIKKLKNAENLTDTQIDIFVKLVNYIPVDYIDEKYALVCYLITEKILIKSTAELDLATRNTILRINFKTYDKIIHLIPLDKVETLLFNSYELSLSSELSRDYELFNKFIRTTFGYIIKETNYTVLSHIVKKLLKNLQKTTDKLSDAEMAENEFNNFKLINNILLIVLDRICKVQEIKHNQSAHFNECIKTEFKKILEYLIEFNSTSISNRQIEEAKDENNFHLCSILIRCLCSKTSESLIDESFKENFNQLLKKTLKLHKSQMRSVGDGVKLTNTHLDFLKLYLFNADLLLSKYDVGVKKVKVLQQLLNYIICFNDNAYDSEPEFVAKLNRTFVLCMNNSLDLEEFKSLFQSLDNEVFIGSSSGNRQFTAIFRIMKIFEEFCGDFEVNATLKEYLSFYLQNFLLKIQHYYQILKNTYLDDLITLLHIQDSLLNPKHVSLTSDTVATSLQLYYTLSFETMNVKQFAELVTIIARHVNILVTKYSNKFIKKAAIISSLLMNVLGAATLFSDQNQITPENFEITLKAVQTVERIITQLVEFKTEFSKLCPYIIAEYVIKASALPLHPKNKASLTNAMYHLLSICDIHSISQLHVVLPPGSKELFKTIYSEYEKYFKFSGKI